MAKHLNVNLQFTADTSQAASQIKSLQSLLAGLTNGSAIGKDLPITKELTEAQQAAGRLKAVLADSLNPKGTVDIGRFTQNFKKAGLDINKVKSQMESLGPAGSKAFAQLAQSVATADAPLRRTSKLMSELSTTLKNTARWQLTSSMIHGFMGGLQEAYSYAQSLDKSLTNIRIVSGLSADEMARFAEQANKSAQALSTTTTKYTDAALIYYQQGLKDNEVKERTDTTIKMANVTGEQVQDVSSYMTAIWNNFNKDGDRAVEHYGDIMTKLGAETAASTDEIAAGLSKFSAVADTVGLSFEMASSSVTAIVDQTREAPEVVGTALKTIFSRVEGLKQGETLEDGVDLNKYSQGLKTVGVNIMDTSGNLKDMDQILHEIGDRWETLDKNQQVALAQTVAGVRQYNQFIALFDNWDKVEENLGRAAEATNTLTEQNEVYEESWEAAKNRVTAAAQAIYSDLLDDNFFKNFLDSTAAVLRGVDEIIDSMGGLGGVVSALGVIFTKVFEKQMLAGISSVAYNLKQMTKAGKAENEAMRKDAFESWRNSGALSDTKEGKFQTNAINAQATLQEKLYNAAKHLDEETLKRLQHEIDINKQLQEQTVKMGQQADLLNEKMSKTGTQTMRKAVAEKIEGQDDKEVRSVYAKAASNSQKNMKNVYSGLTGATEVWNKDTENSKNKKIKNLRKEQNKAGNEQTVEILDKLIRKLERGKKSAEEMNAAIMEVVQGEDLLNATSEDSAKKFQEDMKDVSGIEADDILKMTDAQAEATRENAVAEKQFRNTKKATEELSATIDKTKTAFSTFGTSIVNSAQAISSISMGIYSLVGAWNTLKNEDMGFFEKVLSITMSLSMALPMLASGFQLVRDAELLDAAAKALDTLAILANTVALNELNEEKVKEVLTNIGVSESSEELTEDQLKEAMAHLMGKESLEKYNKELAEHILLKKMAGQSTGLDKGSMKGLFGDLGKGFGNIGKSFGGFLKSLKGALPIIGKVVSKFLPIVGIAAGLVTIWQLWKRYSPEGQLAKLEEKAAAAQQALGGVSQELQNTINKKSGLDSLYETLKNCTIGSIEWKQALIDVNQQVLELINTYPELAKYLERDENGVLSISEEGWDQLIDKQTAAVNAATKNSLQAQADVATEKASNRQNRNSFKVEESRTLKGTTYTYERRANDVDMAGYRAIAEVLNTNPELLAYNDEKGSNYTSEDATKRIEAATGIKVTSDFLISAMENYGDEMYELYALTEESKILEQQAMEATVQLYEDVLKSDAFKGDVKKANTEEVAGILARTQKTDQMINKNNLELKGKNKVQDYYEDLVLGREMTDEEKEDFNKQWKDKDSKDALLDNLATQMAAMDQTELEEICGKGFQGLSDTEAKNADRIVSAINENKNLSQQEKNVANQFLSTGTLAGISKEDYSSMDANADGSIDGNEVVNFAGTAFGGKDQKLSDEEAQNMGYDSAQAFIQAFADEVAKGWDEEAFKQREAEQTDLKVDEDVDAGDLKTLTKYYEEYGDTIEGVSDELKDNYAASEKVAHSILRFDNAIEDITENGEDWEKTLDKINDQGGVVDADDVENLEEMRDAYGDLLDIDGESLSDDFLKNSENLELMKQAANGSEEAYDKLQEAVQKDILAHCDIDTTAFDAAKARLDTALDKKNFDDIEIGANLKGDGALRAMEDLVNAAGMTAQEATDYLASMGIDAEVVENKKSKTETVAYNVEPEPDTVEVPYSPAVVGGKPGKETATYPVIKYKKTPVKAKKEIGGTSLKVKSARKSSGGGFKFKSSGGSGGSGGGGGGGGSSAPTRRTASKKSVKTEKERYYTVTNQLEDLEHQLDKIEKAKDRAFGKNKIKAIDEEAAALNSLLEKQREYQQEIQDYLQKDKDKLVDMKIGVQFDKNGTITNYDKLIEDATKTFNDRISSYNAQSGSTQESWDKKYENAINKETGEVYGSYEGWAQAEFDKVKDAIDQYTETQDLAKDVESQIQDTLNQIYDLKLEKVEYTVELKVDVAEDSLELIDFLMERIEDDAFKAAEQIDYLGQTIDNSMDKIAAHRQGLVDLFNNHDLDGSALVAMLEAGDVEGFAAATKGIDFTEAEIDFIREAKSEILDNLSEIRDAQIQVIELVGEVFDSHMEEFDKIIEKTEHLQDVTNAYKEIVQLTGKKSSSAFKETMQMLNSTATDLAISQIGRTKAKYDEATREYNDALAQRQAAMEAGDEELVKHWDEVCEEIQDGMNDAQKEFMDAWVAGLEQAREEFQENMALIIEDFKIQMGGLAGSLDALSNQFDLHSQMTSNYLPDYERVYELNKLMRDINDSIDETDNVKAKRELLELEQEINKAREDGKPMSEYDLNYLRKRYELKVAELELKESKDAKSQVRMTKDSEGNFGYVYTADDAMVETAEQNYEDKLFEMQQMNAEYINTLQQSMIDLNNEYASQFEQLGELYEIGSAEYVAALEQLQAWYANQQIFYQGQLDGVMTNNGILYETEVVKYAEMTNNKALLDLEYISKFEQLPLAMLTGFTSMAEYQAMWEQQAAQMYDQAGTNAENFQARNDEAMAAAGEDIETFSDTVQEEVEEIRAQNEQITTEMDETLQTVQKNWDDTIGKVKLFETQYTTTVGNLIKLNTNLTDSMNKMLAAWSGVKEEEIKQNQPKPTTSSTGGGGGGGGGGGAPSLRAGAKIGYTGRYHANSYGTGTSGSWYSGQKNKVKISRYSLRPYGSQSSGGRYAIHIETLSGGPLGWIKPSQAFDTGGYTGKWGGKEGRMAMLHQKEIVLNETDTANFLKTVEIVRKISQTIDLNALSSAGGLSRGLHSTGITNNNRDTLKQDVHITAEFPNATDKNEILQAFDNVINLAAQYANRK